MASNCRNSYAPSEGMLKIMVINGMAKLGFSNATVAVPCMFPQAIAINTHLSNHEANMA